jgi:hypothetical protein
MLENIVASRAGSIFWRHEIFVYVSCFVLVSKFGCPLTIGQEISEEFALTVAAVIMSALFPFVETQIAKITVFARRADHSVCLQTKFAD